MFDEKWLEETLRNNPDIKVRSKITKVDSGEYYMMQKQKIKNKYGNTRTKVDGMLFDSKKESDTYPELEMLLAHGKIAGYCRQPQFVLQKGNDERKPITYKADWIIFYPNGKFEIRDDKGFLTDVYKIKKKMFQERFPELEIVET